MQSTKTKSKPGNTGFFVRVILASVAGGLSVVKIKKDWPKK